MITIAAFGIIALIILGAGIGGFFDAIFSGAQKVAKSQVVQESGQKVQDYAKSEIIPKIKQVTLEAIP